MTGRRDCDIRVMKSELRVDRAIFQGVSLFCYHRQMDY